MIDYPLSIAKVVIMVLISWCGEHGAHLVWKGMFRDICCCLRLSSPHAASSRLSATPNPLRFKLSFNYLVPRTIIKFIAASKRRHTPWQLFRAVTASRFFSPRPCSGSNGRLLNLYIVVYPLILYFLGFQRTSWRPMRNIFVHDIV